MSTAAAERPGVLITWLFSDEARHPNIVTGSDMAMTTKFEGPQLAGR